MKSAEEIFLERFRFESLAFKEDVIAIINIARKEAIEECANLFDKLHQNEWFDIHKRSILSLIKELK